MPRSSRSVCFPGGGAAASRTLPSRREAASRVSRASAGSFAEAARRPWDLRRRALVERELEVERRARRRGCGSGRAGAPVAGAGARRRALARPTRAPARPPRRELRFPTPSAGHGRGAPRAGAGTGCLRRRRARSPCADRAILVQQVIEEFAARRPAPDRGQLPDDVREGFEPALSSRLRPIRVPRRRLRVELEMEPGRELAELLLLPRVIEVEQHQPRGGQRARRGGDVLAQHVDRAVGAVEREVDARLFGDVRQLGHVDRWAAPARPWPAAGSRGGRHGRRSPPPVVPASAGRVGAARRDASSARAVRPRRRGAAGTTAARRSSPRGRRRRRSGQSASQHCSAAARGDVGGCRVGDGVDRARRAHLLLHPVDHRGQLDHALPQRGRFRVQRGRLGRAGAAARAGRRAPPTVAPAGPAPDRARARRGRELRRRLAAWPPRGAPGCAGGPAAGAGIAAARPGAGRPARRARGRGAGGGRACRALARHWRQAGGRADGGGRGGAFGGGIRCRRAGAAGATAPRDCFRLRGIDRHRVHQQHVLAAHDAVAARLQGELQHRVADRARRDHDDARRSPCAPARCARRALRDAVGLRRRQRS